MKLFRCVDPTGLQRTILEFLAGNYSSFQDVTFLRVGREGGRVTARIARNDGTTLIIKYWARNSWPWPLYLLGYTWSTASREWRIPKRLRAHNIQAANTLAYLSGLNQAGGFVEIVAMEDLGETSSPVDHIKTLIACNQRLRLQQIESVMIGTTASFVENGFVDTDHSLANFVLVNGDRLQRVDFEHCYYLGKRALPFFNRAYGTMLARLIESYAYAVQPDIEFAERLGHGIAERLRPPASVLRFANKEIHRRFLLQEQEKGITTRLTLDW